jgi:hypothetical protein
MILCYTQARTHIHTDIYIYIYVCISLCLYSYCLDVHYCNDSLGIVTLLRFFFHLNFISRDKYFGIHCVLEENPSKDCSDLSVTLNFRVGVAEYAFNTLKSS